MIKNELYCAKATSTVIFKDESTTESIEQPP